MASRCVKERFESAARGTSFGATHLLRRPSSLPLPMPEDRDQFGLPRRDSSFAGAGREGGLHALRPFLDRQVPQANLLPSSGERIRLLTAQQGAGMKRGLLGSI